MGEADRRKIDIQSIIKRMTVGQGSIESGVGKCSAFCIVKAYFLTILTLFVMSDTIVLYFIIITKL